MDHASLIVGNLAQFKKKVFQGNPLDQIERNILHSAYMKTIFVIGDGKNSFEVSPLEVNQSFLKFLQDSGILSWAVITSDNPFSKLLSVEKNNERRKNL